MKYQVLLNGGLNLETVSEERAIKRQQELLERFKDVVKTESKN